MSEYSGKHWTISNKPDTVNINSLKSKKRANGTFIEDYGINHPKEAIIVLGHGGELWKWGKMDRIPVSKEVPKGTIVVMKAHPGDVTVDEDSKIHELFKNEDVTLDPVGRIDELTKLLGSVSIFREGDICPDTQHIYCSVWGHDKPENLYIEMKQSGIVSIPLKNTLPDLNYDTDVFANFTKYF